MQDEKDKEKTFLMGVSDNNNPNNGPDINV